ncbi:hypothetical protein M426DRAFT_315971 [Hypoxylon sp. CI-4A]|nr:hypothetical protein M426DRAFT_315971 [Hypoxylon sp. CI-4A]
MPGFTVAAVAASSNRRGGPREAAPPRPLPHQLAGCILWLPRKSELREQREDSDSDLEEDRCNHPVVILSPAAEDGKVMYLMVTSLKGKDLATRFKYDSSVRLAHLPIRPCDPHPDNGLLLSLEDVTLQLQKKSYVKTNVHHRIRLTSLRAYSRSGPDYVLSRKSYQDLIEYAKFTPPPLHPASNTVSTPGRVPLARVTRGRSGSYSEYLSLQRSGTGSLSPPPAAVSQANRVHYPPITERDPLLAAPSYNYHRPSYSSYPGSYPTRYVGGQPARMHSSVHQAASRGPRPPDEFDWALFRRRMKRLVLFVMALVSGYLTYKGLCWLGNFLKETGTAVKDGVANVGSKIEDIWLQLGAPGR